MKKKGFTLVLVIVIVIVGILSIVAVPIYKAYVRRSMATEGKALLSSVLTAEKAYFAEYGNYKEFDSQIEYDEELGVDGRSNKYFRLFLVSESVNPGEFYARTDSIFSEESNQEYIILHFGKTMTPSWEEHITKD
jgi:Tfp pilus assembly protein PilE